MMAKKQKRTGKQKKSDFYSFSSSKFYLFSESAHYDYENIGVWQSDEAEAAAKYAAKPGDYKIKDQNNDGAIGEQDKVILYDYTR